MGLFHKKRSILPDDLLKNYFSYHQIKDDVLCKAPYASVYINNNGEFLPCCWYDTDFKFASYPDKSIYKALLDKKRKKLQSSIASFDLSYGCDLCLQAVKANQFEAVIASHYKNLIINKKFPDKIEFELSHFCNLDCIMCGTHSRENENATVFNEKFLDELKPYLSNAGFCSFYGGEPLLSSIYYKILDLIETNNRKCEIYIQTNGTIINPRIIELINKLNIHLGISLDAVTPALFENIRKNADFEQVKQNIEAYNSVLRSNNRYLQISACPMPVNIHEIPPLMDYCNSLHAQIFFNTVNFPKKFSLSQLGSDILNSYVKLLASSRYQSFGNPNFENNQIKLDGLIQMIQYFSDRNKALENSVPSEKLSKVISGISAHMKDKEIAARFKGLFQDLDQNQPVSPITIYEISLIDYTRFSKIIKTCIENNNYQIIYNIIGIQGS